MTIPNNWTEGDIDLGNGLIHYYRAGAPFTPAVVLAHGFSDHGLCWIPTANALASSYDVIMPDSRGHGRSARVKQGGTYDIVEDLIRILGVLNVNEAIVFGHSMGALQASVLASRRPELVRALVLIDPPWHDASPEGVAIMRADTTRGNWDWVKQLPDKTEAQLMEENRNEHPTWPAVIIEQFSKGKKLLDQNVLDTTLIPLTKLWPPIDAIQCPTLLVTGDPELGGIVTPELSQAIAQRNSNFSVSRIRNTGHHMNFARQDVYLEAVQSFLSKLS
jgi:N-formylmaleamate deformylase